MANTPSNKKLAGMMPDPGPGRFWDVELVKNSSANPIKVSLKSEVVEGRTNMGETLYTKRTIASDIKVVETAELMLTEIGGHEKVVGKYGHRA